MTINLSINVPEHKLGETLSLLAQAFGSSPAEKVETAVAANVTVDPAVEYETRKVEGAVPAKPLYSLTAIRAKAKEVAEVRGKAFIKDALESVGSKTVSNIPEEKFDDFMNYLNGGGDE
jgi:hypothetical protein